MNFAEAYATPDGATPRAARLCQDLREFFRRTGYTSSPGYRVFRTGEEHALYGEYCTGAALVLVYEGTDIAHMFSMDYAYPDYEPWEVMNDFLEERGWYHEQGTSYYGGFYRMSD